MAHGAFPDGTFFYGAQAEPATLVAESTCGLQADPDDIEKVRVSTITVRGSTGLQVSRAPSPLGSADLRFEIGLHDFEDPRFIMYDRNHLPVTVHGSIPQLPPSDTPNVRTPPRHPSVPGTAVSVRRAMLRLLGPLRKLCRVHNRPAVPRWRVG